jgi:hypothetical protein
MTCDAYRERHPALSRVPLPRAVWDTPAYEAWAEHAHRCAACDAWGRAQRLAARGVDPSAYPCVHMAEQATHRCEQHPDPQDCPDVLVRRLPGSGAYGLPIRDGGSSLSIIHHCPWCGTTLPGTTPDPRRR